jgi:protein O-mannosyl-transferase
MDGLIKTTEKKEIDTEFSFKNFFVPFTTLKAIHWIVFIGIIVYFNVLFNGFVWDDLTYMVNNPAVHTFNLSSLFHVDNQYFGTGYYRPIAATYISLLWNLFGTSPFFYHFIQILIHIAGTCLLFIFLKRFFNITIAFFLSLIFLVHPMQVDSVSYISDTQVNLFFLFGMIAVLISLKKNLHLKHFLLISFFLLFSILTKETGALFIPVILLYQFLYKRQYFLPSLAFSFCVIIVYSLMRFAYAHDVLQKNTTIPIDLLSLPERVINIPAIFFYYVKTFLYPVNINIDQQWLVTSLSFNDFYYPLIMSGVFFLFLFGFGIFLYKKNKKKLSLYLFFVVWYFLGIGLVLQIFPLDATVSDRWIYFPMVGLLGILGILSQSVSFKKKIFKNMALGVAIVYISLLGLRTIVRNTNYVDQLTLFSHDAAIAKNGFDMENHFAESRKHFQKAVVEMPCLDSTSNLEIVDQQVGDLQAVARDKMILAKCADKRL